jgi:hypothetical protein
MANSTTNLKTITSSQYQKEVTANGLFDACSPATIFGRKDTSAGLNWDYYGGTLLVDGIPTQISNGSVTLTASATNYVQATRAGVVSSSTSTVTAGNFHLYSVTTNTTSVTQYYDYRAFRLPSCGRLAKALTDANTTLADSEARNQILEFTGTLTATRDIVVPLAPFQWTVYNGTNQSLRFIGATGTGITVATTKRAIVYSDGTNVVRVTADT